MSNGSEANARAPNWERRVIALGITGVSIVGLVIIAWVTIDAATDATDQNNVLETSRMVFTALLPLFGTWVGTVLAFYFSKDNFEAANKSMQDIVKTARTSMEKLRAIPAKSTMVAKAKIKGYDFKAGDRDTTVLFNTIADFVKPQNITRVPVFNEDGSVRYVIHESMIYKFKADKSDDKAFDLARATLDDFVSHPDMKALVETAIAFMPISGTLADAKQAMDKVDRCQDVFVTKTGARTESVEGWLTNVDIAKHAEL